MPINSFNVFTYANVKSPLYKIARYDNAFTVELWLIRSRNKNTLGWYGAINTVGIILNYNYASSSGYLRCARVEI